jgi:hypothetical protein
LQLNRWGWPFFIAHAIRKEVQAMTSYPLRELISLWHRGNLTVEQMLGQILLHLLEQEKELAELKRQLPKPPPKKKE